jgi:glycosyltransferase involved in cell wall biosynthesis
VALVVPGGVARDERGQWFPYLVGLVGRLARRHDVQVFALFQEWPPARYPLAGATVHTGGAVGPGQRRVYWRVMGAILREHRRAAFDLLHAFWVHPAGLIAGIAGRVLRRPVVLHVAGGELVTLPDIGYGGWSSGRERLWSRLALASASRVTGGSSGIIARLAELGYAAERIPFGVDLSAWPPSPPLEEAGVDFRLDVAGFDTRGGRVQQAARHLGLGGRVRFHGHLSPAQLRPLFDAADLLLMSSRHEAGPFVLLEAAVAGVPTVGTAVGQIADWAPAAAVAVPVGDAAALARETAALLADDGRRLGLAHEAQRRAVGENVDWVAARIEAVYRELRRPPVS